MVAPILRTKDPLALFVQAFEPVIRLRAKFAELAQDRLDVHFVFQVHLEIRLGLGPVFQRLPVLAHNDEGPLERHEDREEQVEKHVRERIERLTKRRVEHGPTHRQRFTQEKKAFDICNNYGKIASGQLYK